jgi:hypothetical protein
MTEVEHKNIGQRRFRNTAVLALLILVAVFNWYLFFSGVNPDQPADAPSVKTSGLAESDNPIERLPREIEERIAEPYSPSLEVKEQIDFLLTPAIIVEEVLACETVVTYPGE